MSKADSTQKTSRKRHGCAKRGNKSPEYRTWMAIRHRCRSPANSFYKRYGGRGIKICPRWNEFPNFLADMGVKPSPKHQIDRIDNDGDYEPSNCRWATPKEQARNTSRSRKVTFKGATKTVAEWAEGLGWHQNVLHDRLRLGWTDEEAITTPKKKRGKPKNKRCCHEQHEPC